MKQLFSKPGKHIRLADKARLIFEIDGAYYDTNGTCIPAEDCFRATDDYLSYNHWEDPEWLEQQGLDEPLEAVSTTEPKTEIDDVFGMFGFQNRAGEFVIEPQYAFAHDFTCGLAAVNLNRTWYRTETGDQRYENHSGFIDAHGKTVIPFIYDEVRPFNQYGVAVAETLEHSYLIDTKGQIVPGTEKYDFLHYYDYSDRFFEITFGEEIEDADGAYGDLIIGIYDTKNRKVLLEPSIEAFFIEKGDVLCIWQLSERNEYGFHEHYVYYIDENGELLFPWLLNKGFEHIEPPNKAQISIVGIREYFELTGEPPIGYFLSNGKKYDRKDFYGLYSSKEKLLLPLKYESIREVSENIFACFKDGIITVFEAEEND